MAVNKALKKQMLAFTITGASSTLFMYLIYIGLYRMMNFQFAYVIAYVCSVILLYFMNSFVFKGDISIKTASKFPLIYLLQYALSAFFLEILVRLGFSVTFAPLLIILLLFPLIFVLNRKVFKSV